MSLTLRTDRTGPNYDNDDDDDDVEEDADGCDHLMMTQGDEMDKKWDTGDQLRTEEGGGDGRRSPF